MVNLYNKKLTYLQKLDYVTDAIITAMFYETNIKIAAYKAALEVEKLSNMNKIIYLISDAFLTINMEK